MQRGEGGIGIVGEKWGGGHEGGLRGSQVTSERLTFRSLCTMNFWWQYCTADTICKRRGGHQGETPPQMGIAIIIIIIIITLGGVPRRLPTCRNLALASFSFMRP